MGLTFEKVAIANRGEVAVRIIRACEELGIKSVLLHSEADIDSVAYRLADEVVCIGASPVNESYLNIENTINGALSVDADAIHPGFGFLSENADFAEACEKNRIVMIGPSPESIRLFGDKISAKELVAEAGGPIIGGYQGEDQSLQTLLTEVEKIGLPVLCKAAAGGGGRGLKVIRDMNQAQEAIESAQREGLNAFGSSRVFLEKYLEKAKHIEVQIFGDASGEIFHLYERECSVQRRHQKVVEEAQSMTLSESLRQEILQAAVNIARKAKYRGAGTVEFLVEDEKFYFLEMNTRLQVEHPVTELLTGIDLVKAQIITAQEKPLLWAQDKISPRGHAIECRLYAEDPYANGLPSTGVLGFCSWPYGPGRRFDMGFEEGDRITSFYDSMIAKVIVWDETRTRAILKMKKTLEEVVIFGLKTNIPFLQSILSHPDFEDGTMTTRFIETYYDKGLEPEEIDEDEKSFQEKLLELNPKGSTHRYASSGVAEHPNPFENTWSRS